MKKYNHSNLGGTECLTYYVDRAKAILNRFDKAQLFTKIKFHQLILASGFQIHFIHTSRFHS